jgi:uncharacterized protein YkwD
VTSPSTARRFRSTAKLAALVVAMTLALSACYTTQQNEIAQRVNNSRAAAGRAPLGQNLELSMKAQRWAEHLAARGALAHSSLPDGITYRWRSLGENVGVGSSIGAVHQGYMSSPGHRANILSSTFDYIGTGYATGGGRVYTVQVFMDY